MNFIQKELITTITGITEENLQETQEKVNKLFEFAELSRSIWGKIPNFRLDTTEHFTDDISKNDVKQASILTTNANSCYFPLKKEADLQSGNPPTRLVQPIKSYPLQRKLKGGILALEKGDCYVPEKEIRLNGFVHGDFLQVKGTGKNLIFTKVKESQNENESDRCEIDYCVLTKSPDGFIVASKQIIDGEIKTIKLDGDTPHQFLISDVDIKNYSLKEGKVVCIAYSKENPVSKRVVWHYDEAEVNYRTKKIS